MSQGRGERLDYIVQLRLPATLLTPARALSDREERSLSWALRALIKQGLTISTREEHEKTRPVAAEGGFPA